MFVNENMRFSDGRRKVPLGRNERSGVYLRSEGTSKKKRWVGRLITRQGLGVPTKVFIQVVVESI